MTLASYSRPALKSVAKEPKLLDRLADALHQRKYLPALIHDYVEWVRRFIFFHERQHPVGLGLPHVQGYLDYLGGDGGATLFERAKIRGRQR